MFKFLKKHPAKDSEEREKLKKELFGFKRCTEHGFINKPACMDYDPKLQLLAIGNKQGYIKILGQPGVEFCGELKSGASVNQLFFLSEEARLISLCGDNTITLWEINDKGENTILEDVKEFKFSAEESKFKNISVCCLTKNKEHLLIGTEIGNIFILDLKTFQLLDQIIYQDVVMQNVPDDFKVNPGAVEAIAVHPINPDKVLIGYNRGLIVLWDNKTSNTDQTYNSTQQLESLCWHRNGEEFMSAHIDGSYIVWNASDSTTPKESALTPYGPFPCKAISKVEWKTSKSEPFIIFSGGMPRASYGDKHTISVMEGSNHVVFDFTSKVIDFITLGRADSDDEDNNSEHDDPHCLIVLLEEELIVIDLDSSQWPTFQNPYLNSLHSSPITCSHHVANVPDPLWQKIVDVGESQAKNHSKREWPINGGKLKGAEGITKDLLLTGHEDGTVKFWDASGLSMKLLYSLSTATMFSVDFHPGEQSSPEVEEEWPPFRKVGIYDPFSDDPRLGIQKISMCPLSETCVIAGTAGQVLVLQMEREEREYETSSDTMNIVSDRDNFVWKGHEALKPRDGEVKYAAGFQPTAVIQLYPPAACTALAFHSEWQLMAAGTAHGFALFDYAQKKPVATRCTLNPDDMTGTSETPMSRRKSLKKSLRESFRRLRRRRSERRQDKAKPEQKTDEKEKKSDEGSSSPSKSRASPGASPEPRPVERQIEARNPEETIGSMVRCLYFANTFVTNGTDSAPSLWVGTNGGHVYIYTMTVPTEKRNESDVIAIIAKEIKLRHKAPVIHIAVVDGKSRVIPDALEVENERAKAADYSGAHHTVIICSEEQLKIFTLPHLKAKLKYKVTALDGSRIRKVAFINFRSKSDENYNEFDIACLTNLGDLSVHTVNSLRQQLVASALKREDITGISSFIFTKHGQGFYLLSSSEYARVTLSSRNVTEPNCTVELKDGMRPEPEPEPEVVVEPQKEEAEEKKEEEGGLTPDDRYNSGDIAEALNESQLNDSQANTTVEGEVTQDSIQVLQDSSVVESTTLITTSETTVVTTTEETVTHTVTAGGDGPESVNIDDDTKSTQPIVTTTTQVITDVNEVHDKIIELKITEDDAALAKKNLQDAEQVISTEAPVVS
ncbi:lethal(2) giant larvae protein homolog 1-like isoform X2 [Mytilus californianus]|nr:lethal(2) giant larvae protein homolog 1-like isoform X2 [Mytilus californianus]